MNLEDQTIRDVTAGLGGSLGNEDPFARGSGGVSIRSAGIPPRSHQQQQRKNCASIIPWCVDCNAAQDMLRARGWVKAGRKRPRFFLASQPGQAARALNIPTLLPAKWESPMVHAVRWKNEGLDIEDIFYLPLKPLPARH